jgi:hypothetical protein
MAVGAHSGKVLAGRVRLRDDSRQGCVAASAFGQWRCYLWRGSCPVSAAPSVGKTWGLGASQARCERATLSRASLRQLATFPWLVCRRPNPPPRGSHCFDVGFVTAAQAHRGDLQPH